MKTLLVVFAIFAAGLQAQTRSVILVRGSATPATPATLTLTAVPSPGLDIRNWNSTNVFDFSDGTASDWRMWISTANDTRDGGLYQQDIQLRKTAAPVQISDLSYLGSGVTGPSEDRFGGHSYTNFSRADNDRSTVDYTGSAGGKYFYYIGNGNNFSRFFESSSFLLKCLNSSTLISGCGERLTITPATIGAQNAWVWVRQEGVDARLTVTGGGTTSTIDLPAGVAEYEGVVKIPLNPSTTSTAYTVTITPLAAQSGASTGFVGMTRARLGGTTAGNVSDAVLATTGSLTPQDHVYGSRVSQVAPNLRAPVGTTSITLVAGNDLQSAVNMAAGGTDIHLPLGYVWTGNLILPKRNENGWVRIIADGAPSLTPGHRANPADYPGGSSSPAKIITPNELAAIANYQGAPGDTDLTLRAVHHYELLGLEIVANGASADINYEIVQFAHGGGFGVPQPALDGSSQPHDNLVVGCYLHRTSNLLSQVTALYLNSDASGAYDNYISGSTMRGGYSQQSNAIGINDTRGPITIKNNYLEAPGSDVIFGGGPAVPFMIPSDIEIVDNYFTKDLYYNTQDNSGNYPRPTDVKNGLEFKTGQYVTVTGNIFEHIIAGNHFNNGQDGQAIFVRSFTAGGSQPSETAHYLIQNNIVMNGSVGVSFDPFEASGAGDPSAPNEFKGPTKAPNHYLPRSHDAMVRNNLFERLSFTKWGLYGRGFYTMSTPFAINYPPVNLTIDRNTGTFDWLADQAYIDGRTYAMGVDVSLHNDGGTISQLDVIDINARAGLSTSPYRLCDTCFDKFSSVEANQSWVFTNNVLAGGMDGAGSIGSQAYSYLMTWENNSYYGILPNYQYDRMLQATNTPDGNFHGPRDSSHIFGNTFTASETVPVVTGRGVDPSTLPDICTVRTGNRSDIACDPGYLDLTGPKDARNALVTQTVARGASITVTVNFDGSRLSGAITPSVTGLPSGVTYSFSPSTVAAIGGASTLTLSASSGATVGSVTATLTGTAGTTTANAPLLVTVQ